MTELTGSPVQRTAATCILEPLQQESSYSAVLEEPASVPSEECFDSSCWPFVRTSTRPQDPGPVWVVSEPIGRSLSDERGEINWAALTTVEAKQRCYSVETYFREAWADAKAVLGADPTSTLHRFSMIIFKPDAIVGRRVERALQFLSNHQLNPIYAVPVRYGRLSLREDWRYQLNQLTLDRMRLNTIMDMMGDSLVVVLRDDQAVRTLPASVRLQMLKGSSFPERQQKNHLRYALQSWSRLLKFIHTPDEPADLIREIGILFDEVGRQTLMQVMALHNLTDGQQARDGQRQVKEQVEALYTTTVPQELEVDISWQRITEDLRFRAKTDPRVDVFRETLEQTIFACRRGRFLSWKPIESAMHANKIPVTWDYIVVAAAFIQHSFEDEVALVTSDGTDGWLRGRGVFLS